MADDSGGRSKGRKTLISSRDGTRDGDAQWEKEGKEVDGPKIKDEKLSVEMTVYDIIF